MAQNVGIDRKRLWWWSVMVPVTGILAGAYKDWMEERKMWLDDPQREGLWLGVWHTGEGHYEMEFCFSNANTAMEFKLRWA